MSEIHSVRIIETLYGAVGLVHRSCRYLFLNQFLLTLTKASRRVNVGGYILLAIYSSRCLYPSRFKDLYRWVYIMIRTFLYAR